MFPSQPHKQEALQHNLLKTDIADVEFGEMTFAHPKAA
jgi:hypothetical protein